MAKTKEVIKKVIAEIREVSEPIYDATFKCPYCKHQDYERDIESENFTMKVNCWKCKKDYKVKIPKYY